MTQTIPGGLTVANDVIADLAGYATLESYGIVGMAAPTLQDGIAKLLPRQRLRRGIIVETTAEGQTKIDLFIVVEYGTNIAAVSANLVDKVTYDLRSMAGLENLAVEVHVQGVHVRD